jgi:putative ABC transport system permease protein
MAGAPDTLGREIDLNGVRTTVIGIMPHRFGGPESHDNIDGWLPIALPPAVEATPIPRSAVRGTVNEADLPTCVADGTLNVYAHLKPGIAFGAAARQSTDASGIERLPDWRGKTGGRVQLDRLENFNVTDLRTPLLALVGAVGFVLLIACANVANLQLERAVGRRRELAIRLAIGATRRRVLRQMLTETLLLYLVGGAAGVVAAMWTLHVIVALLPAGVPHVDDVAVNARVLAATLALSCAAGLAVGLVPALTATSPATVGDLKISAPTGSRVGTWIRHTLVVAQVALSLTLMVGAGLMVRTFLALRPVRPGFTAADKVTAVVRERSPSVVPPVIFFRKLFDRLAEIPGTQAVSGSTYLPMSGVVTSGRVSAGETTLSPWEGAVTPNYFAEMHIAIVRGRDFAATDDLAAPPVAIVNETFAHRAWADRDPIGATVVTRARGGAQMGRRVVGVARDTRSLGGDLKTRPELYVPFAQDAGPNLNIIVRTSDPFDVRLPAELRAAAAGLDPLQVVDRIRPLQAMVDAGVSTPRFGAWLLGAFAGMALLLAAVGLAASIAWWVAQRTREVGVRMALGANPSDVSRMFLRQGLGLTLTGIALGIAGAAASTRLLETWLFGVTPLDPAAFTISALAMLAIAALASYLPARRATRIDPLLALRAE